MKLRNEDKYDEIFKKYASEYALDWLLLKAQVKQESRFNPDAKSPVGAEGLAQFMPLTWKEWYDGIPGIQGKPTDIHDPDSCIHAQTAYMAWLIKQFNGNIKLALSAYNWGIGFVKRLVLHRGNQYESLVSFMPRETQNYVHRIMTYLKEYQEANI